MKINIDIGGSYKIPPENCPSCDKPVRDIMNTDLPYGEWFVSHKEMKEYIELERSNPDLSGRIEVTYECGAAVRKPIEHIDHDWSCSDWEDYSVCRDPKAEIVEALLRETKDV
jgi:hypothetical protein